MRDRTLAFVLAVVLAPLSVLASETSPPRKIRSILDEVFAHFAAGGGGWTTSFTFINLSAGPGTFPLNFWGQDGQAIQVAIRGIGNRSELEITVPGNGSRTVELEDTGNLRVGWAEIDTPFDPDIVGQAVFRQRVAGRPDFEAIVPLSSRFESEFAMQFDNAGGFVTSMAIVNPSSFSTSTVFLDFNDENGNRILLDSITLSPRNQVAFALPQRFPQTAGRQGVLHVNGSGLSLTSLGFRFHPGGAFTTFFPFEK
jgi:hypothetical protein